MKDIRPEERALPLDEYNRKRIKKGSKQVWFLNGDLVRKYHINRANGILTLYNITQDRLQTILMDEFVKKRKRAYSVRDVAYLVNRHPKHMPRLVRDGVIAPPVGAAKDGVTDIGVRAYWSEDDVFEIRDILASRGWKRKDRLVTNNTVPTIQELKRLMGSELLHYTKDEDGRIVPIWNETI